MAAAAAEVDFDDEEEDEDFSMGDDSGSDSGSEDADSSDAEMIAEDNIPAAAFKKKGKRGKRGGGWGAEAEHCCCVWRWPWLWLWLEACCAACAREPGQGCLCCPCWGRLRLLACIGVAQRCVRWCEQWLCTLHPSGFSG